MKVISIFAVLIMSTSVANAAPLTYSFETNNLEGDLNSANGGYNGKGGDVQQLSTSFNGTNFDWQYTAGPGRDNKDNDGFWLVVSDGPNPKAPNQTVDEYAILYGDFNTHDIVAYIYDGNNNPGSFGDRDNYLETFEDALNVSSSTTNGTTNTNVSFSINVSGINSQNISDEWDGIAFGQNLGIWFHPSVNTSISYHYDDSRLISSYSGTAGWMDTAGNHPFTTTQVPEPGTLALLGLGLVAMSRKRTARFSSK